MNAAHALAPTHDREPLAPVVRQVRQCYIHRTCGGVTVIHYEIAAALARQPQAFLRFFCQHCVDYLPIAQFDWYEPGQGTGG